jgi:dephospho-CoA kinase
VRRLGLTGGIASGKSAVAGMLRDMGFQVLDADSVSHRLIEPGQPAYDEVLREFGSDLADATGRINRAKLGAIVFADPQKLAMFRQFDEWQRSGIPDAAFVEAALLVEAGMDKNLDGLVVVWCRPEQQLERMRARGMNEAEARRRIASQLPLEEKMRHATYKIDCSGSIEQTRRQVEALAAKLRHPDQPPPQTQNH